MSSRSFITFSNRQQLILCLCTIAAVFPASIHNMHTHYIYAACYKKKTSHEGQIYQIDPLSYISLKNSFVATFTGLFQEFASFIVRALLWKVANPLNSPVMFQGFRVSVSSYFIILLPLIMWKEVKCKKTPWMMQPKWTFVFLTFFSNTMYTIVPFRHTQVVSFSVIKTVSW